MRAVIQRVARASVHTAGQAPRTIGRGVVVLLGVERGDGPADVEWMAEKIANLRIFPGEGAAGGKHFERSLQDTEGHVLVVSQFTLLGDCRRGRRPSFSAAAPPGEAEPLYRAVAEALAARGLFVQTGWFGADMQVELVNDGPVTLWLDSRA
ncbi:D-tyrosyl-tRNA(Tyr) deacylase [Thermaerobacter sp. PB12/4term]|uniref:D-aminoacyl-tRNA deacylase n=1 Tax=Thermaerobacter sp. PB12/4term TaxID=2293838 RepID=UPI000E32CC25|nr:D-aminoacyl-tRNA deacylase [Thermaerobacter sp. PB12/4term]QIA27160.1 D-tyrosyl-tRNA(Tyr) deacylase [Thermaerobacter sp. PB12/4term]